MPRPLHAPAPSPFSFRIPSSLVSLNNQQRVASLPLQLVSPSTSIALSIASPQVHNSPTHNPVPPHPKQHNASQEDRGRCRRSRSQDQVHPRQLPGHDHRRHCCWPTGHLPGDVLVHLTYGFCTRGHSRSRHHPPLPAPSTGLLLTRLLSQLKDRNGSSRQSLKKYVKANNQINTVSDNMFDSLFNKAIRAGVEKGVFEQPKGTSNPHPLFSFMSLTPQ
ncbi:hypothetical protein LZ30DRAFT_730444 [Colletotrichum cereale]|nr:hypothetical protein LZ30DRAFT_730444 [Colletotrichum cereale]